jgi:hypothetical protein
MGKVGERVSVLAFAGGVIVVIVGAAFALGYIVGKLLL